LRLLKPVRIDLNKEILDIMVDDKYKIMSISLPPDLLARFDEFCKQMGYKRSKYVRQLIEKALEEMHD